MSGSIYSWSTTAAANGNSDPDVNFAEGQAPSTLNNSNRQVMARVAEYLADNGGALAAGGTANVITVTANSAFTAYADGLTLALRITTNNSAATTLNVNGIGAKSVRKMVGSGEVALSGAELQAGDMCVFRYSTALNGAAGGWLLLNPAIDVPNLVTLTGSQTLTNKSLTAPTITTPALVNGTSSGMTLTTATLTSPTLTTPTLTLKQSAAPVPTAEGDVQWDTDDNVLVVGDGAATKIFLPIPASTAAGDLEYFTAAKVKARLAKGTDGQVLQLASGVPAWVTTDFGAGAAALLAGAIGTYGLFITSPSQLLGFGSTTAGSGLRASHTGGFAGADTPSGTWRCMGNTTTSGGTPGATTVFLRIS